MLKCSSTMVLFPVCKVDNCRRCKRGDADTCKRCIDDYLLQTDGTCAEGKGQLKLLPLTVLILYSSHTSHMRHRNETMHLLHTAVTSAGQHGIKIVSILSTCLECGLVLAQHSMFTVSNIDTILLETCQKCVNLEHVFSVLRLVHTGALQQCHFFQLAASTIAKSVRKMLQTHASGAKVATACNRMDLVVRTSSDYCEHYTQYPNHTGLATVLRHDNATKVLYIHLISMA